MIPTPPRPSVAVEAAAGSHLLHVEGYSRTTGVPNSQSIKSHPFKIGGCSWRVWYYPNGGRSNYADYISVFLAIDETVAQPVKAKATFSLLDPAGRPVASHTRTTSMYHYSAGGSGHGFDDFIKREFLEKSVYIKDDGIKIRCDVNISEEIHTEDRAAASPFVVVPPSDMHRHFGDLLATEVGADVTFKVAGETFRTHRNILAARSRVFKAELLGEMRESTATGDCIQIDDMLVEVFKALLHFVYNDSLPEMEPGPSASSEHSGQSLKDPFPRLSWSAFLSPSILIPNPKRSKTLAGRCSASVAALAPGSAALGDGEPRTASAIVGGAVTGHHLLHIDGYSRTKDKLPTGKSIKSRVFSAVGRRWYIHYYPNGQTSKVADFISVFLHLDESAGVPVMARARFDLLDRAGKPVPLEPRTIDLRKFSPGGTGYGFPEFIRREFLEKSDHLFNDCFKISCEIIVSDELRTEDRVAAPPLASLTVPPSDLGQHLHDLLVGKEGADVTFQVAGEAFSAHRILLAARSRVFKAQLLGKMRESTATWDCICIDDMLPQVFKTLLHFIYTDSLPQMEEQQEEALMAQHLLEAADRYDMHRLKRICEDKLCRHLDVSTAATTLVLAEQHHCHGLKEACIEFLVSRHVLEKVMATDGFEHLTKSCPALVKEIMSKLAARC
ncbi:unnamed protein product [Urochloa decumbens]|uniref:Uncharacterized protein n=1 Tax=Urochloa decumbens TaxID=240449 RepID=A0ABC8XYB8_9POAL